MVFNFPKWHSLNRNNSRGYFKWHKSKRKLAQFDRNKWHKYSENTGTNRTEIATTQIKAPIAVVWERWNSPEDIVKWNSASPLWHTVSSVNDLKVGGCFSYRMEAKDGSMGFDFQGVYDIVDPEHKISYTMADGRKVDTVFIQKEGVTYLESVFNVEQQNSVEAQRAGWQAILDNFTTYVESLPL